jgi:hypothetical protein
MPKTLILCDSVDADGTVCGQLAEVEFSADVCDDSGRFFEVRHMIFCERCGRRLQIEPVPQQPSKHLDNNNLPNQPR